MDRYLRRQLVVPGTGNLRAAIALCVVFFALYLVTVHARHFAPTTDSVMDHGARLAHTPTMAWDAQPFALSGLAPGEMDCPLPSIVVSRLDPLSEIASLALIFVSTLTLGVLLLLAPPLKPPPQHPRLTLQPLLCRFQL